MLRWKNYLGFAINDKVKALQVQARRERVKAEKIVISLTMKEISNLEKMLGYDNISVD